jgi:hypothetical protein
MEKKQIIKLLSNLSAFNKLDERTVKIISDTFQVDAVQLCQKNGITYFVSNKTYIYS